MNVTYDKKYCWQMNQLLNKGKSLRRAAAELELDYDQVMLWADWGAFPDFAKMIRKYLMKKNKAKYRKKYSVQLKWEFNCGGNNLTFSQATDLALAKILQWQKDHEEFKRTHDESVLRNITSIGQQLLDHMKKGYSFKTFASAIGEFPETINEWLENYAQFKQMASLGELGMVEHLESIGMNAFNGERFPSPTYNFTMKNKAKWRDDKPASSPATRQQVVIVLPERKREIDKSNIIQIQEREIKTNDYEMLE